MRVVIRYMELRIMGARECTPRTSRANATGACSFFCGKEHLRGGNCRSFGTKRQRAKPISKTNKTMKKNKTIKLRDIAALIGYSCHAARDLTRRTDADIKLLLEKHNTPRARYVFCKIKEYQQQIRYRGEIRRQSNGVKYDKRLLKRNINDLARENKQNELCIINEKISRLEEDMKAVVFDREINSQLQALYIKRACVMNYLGMKVDAKTEWLL